MNCTQIRPPRPTYNYFTGVTQYEFYFRYQLEFPKTEVWKASSLDINGYIGVYFIIMCPSISWMCGSNNTEEQSSRFNISYQSYYFDMKSEIRPALRSFILTPGNKHLLQINLIEKRVSHSIMSINDDHDFEMSTYFKQRVDDRSIPTEGEWTEVLLQK
jgi:hypothetical protein